MRNLCRRKNIPLLCESPQLEIQSPKARPAPGQDRPLRGADHEGHARFYDPMLVPTRWVKFVVAIFMVPLCIIVTQTFFTAFCSAVPTGTRASSSPAAAARTASSTPPASAMPSPISSAEWRPRRPLLPRAGPPPLRAGRGGTVEIPLCEGCPVASVVKINVLTVPAEQREVLEKRFASRAGSVEGADGFEWFELLRPLEGDRPVPRVHALARRGVVPGLDGGLDEGGPRRWAGRRSAG